MRFDMAREDKKTACRQTDISRESITVGDTSPLNKYYIQQVAFDTCLVLQICVAVMTPEQHMSHENATKPSLDLWIMKLGVKPTWRPFK